MLFPWQFLCCSESNTQLLVLSFIFIEDYSSLHLIYFLCPDNFSKCFMGNLIGSQCANYYYYSRSMINCSELRKARIHVGHLFTGVTTLCLKFVKRAESYITNPT